MIFKFKKQILTSLLVSFVIFVPILSLADSDVLVNPIGVNSVNGFIKTLLEGVIKIGMPLVALAIIYSGFLFVAAQGNPEKLKKAKDAFIYSLVGAAVLLGAWGIAQLISETVLAL